MWDEQKFQQFKQWMVSYNPSVENVCGMINFLREWVEYKNTMSNSIEVIMTDQLKEYLEFHRMININFKNGERG